MGVNVLERVSVTCNGRAAERRLGWTGEDALVRSSPDPPCRESDKRGQGPSVSAFNGNQDNLGQRRNSTAVTVSLSQQQARNESTVLCEGEDNDRPYLSTVILAQGVHFILTSTKSPRSR